MEVNKWKIVWEKEWNPVGLHICENHLIGTFPIPIDLSISIKMSKSIVSKVADKSSSISCIGKLLSSDLYKSSKSDSSVVSVL